MSRSGTTAATDDPIATRTPGAPPAHEATEAFRDQLVREGLLIAMGVDGLYGRSQVFEEVVGQIDDLLSRTARDDGAEIMRFPPGMGLRQLEESQYMLTLPHLAGCIHSFQGDQDDHYALLRHLREGRDWSGSLSATAVVVPPAACYPVYPVIGARGPLAAAGHLVDVLSYCFRHEPSIDPTRMQMFRMREFVFLGTPVQTLAFRKLWLDRSIELTRALGLPGKLDAANDPFFGPGGDYLAQGQRDRQLKFEMLIPVVDGSRPTACMSFNYHENHFGQLWNILTPDGEVAHTACVGFGMERVALALFHTHGMSPAAWPGALHRTLRP